MIDGRMNGKMLLYILSINIVIEDETGTSKGYGFVRFCDQSERDRSLTELDNTLGLGSKAIKIREALPPKPQ